MMIGNGLYQGAASAVPPGVVHDLGFSPCLPCRLSTMFRHEKIPRRESAGHEVYAVYGAKA